MVKIKSATFDRLKAFISRQLESPRVPISSESILDFIDGGTKASSGVTVSNRTALNLPSIKRAVNLISKDVAKLPLLVYKRDERGRTRDPGHAAFPILRHKANSETTAFVFRQTLIHHVLMHGNGYAWIRRDRNSTPLEMINLNPTSTFPVRENGRLMYKVKVGDQDVKEFPENIFHLKGLGFDGLVGWPVLSLARESFGLGLASQKYGSIFFKNSMRPSVVLEHPGNIGKVATSNIKQSWAAMHTGIENQHRMAVLEDGMKLKQFSINAKDAQLLELQEFNIRQIANWFDVPPHKLGDTTRTSHGSLEQESQSYLDDALDGWLVNFEEEARDKLLTEQQKRTDSHFIEFLRQALVRTDMITRFRAHRIATGGAPFMTINEVRATETLPSMEGFNELILPLNMDSQSGNPSEGDSEEGKDMAGSDRVDDAEKEDRADAIEIHADLVRQQVGKVLCALQIHAFRAARKPAKFLDWLDEFEELNQEHVVKTLGPTIRACGAVLEDSPVFHVELISSIMLSDLRNLMLEASGECRSQELEAGITALFKDQMSVLPEKIIEQILEMDDGD